MSELCAQLQVTAQTIYDCVARDAGLAASGWGGSFASGSVRSMPG
jgi:hypothetical protein